MRRSYWALKIFAVSWESWRLLVGAGLISSTEERLREYKSFKFYEDSFQVSFDSDNLRVDGMEEDPCLSQRATQKNDFICQILSNL